MLPEKAVKLLIFRFPRNRFRNTSESGVLDIAMYGYKKPMYSNHNRLLYMGFFVTIKLDYCTRAPRLGLINVQEVINTLLQRYN